MTSLRVPYLASFISVLEFILCFYVGLFYMWLNHNSVDTNICYRSWCHILYVELLTKSAAHLCNLDLAKISLNSPLYAVTWLM